MSTTEPDPAAGVDPAADPDAAPHERPDPVREVRGDDDRDLGWGDDVDRADDRGRDARWYEEQRPPHWE